MAQLYQSSHRLIKNATNMKNLFTKVLIWCALLPTRWNANRLNYKRAIRDAESQSKRCYIYFLNGKYRVYNRKDVQHLKQEGVLKQHMTLDKMRGIQLYDTQGHYNSHPLYRYITVRGINITYSHIKH